MTVFLLSNRLVLVRHTNRRRRSKDIFVLGAEYQVRWGGITVTVPEGFRTDLSSVPKIVPRWIASKLDGIEASVVHDYVYRSREQPQAYADGLFREMLRLDPTVPGWRRELMYGAVRAFGGGIYDK